MCEYAVAVLSLCLIFYPKQLREFPILFVHRAGVSDVHDAAFHLPKYGDSVNWKLSVSWSFLAWCGNLCLLCQDRVFTSSRRTRFKLGINNSSRNEAALNNVLTHTQQNRLQHFARPRFYLHVFSSIHALKCDMRRPVHHRIRFLLRTCPCSLACAVSRRA